MTGPTDPPPPRGRALVLAGGGLIGIAWEIGVLLGLRDGGTRITGWDRIVGTSAGAVVGAALGTPDGIDRLAAADWTGNGAELAEHMAGLDRTMLARIDALWFHNGTGPDQVTRAEIGRLALASATVAEATFVDSIGRLLPTTAWPAGLCVTAVDAIHGSLRAFDPSSGAALVSAVAASSAIPGVFPPVTIGGRPYVDGGVRSGSSLELAAGHRSVLVVAPARPDGHGDRQLADESALMSDGGSRVVVIRPTPASAAVFGADTLDPSRFSDAFATGRSSGLDAAPTWQAAVAG